MNKCKNTGPHQNWNEEPLSRHAISYIHSSFFYHIEYSNYVIFIYYTAYVSVDMSFDLLQVFHVELGNLHRTSNRNLYLIPEGRLLQFC